MNNKESDSLKALRTALEWYADKDNYRRIREKYVEGYSEHGWAPPMILEDGGSLARSALAELDLQETSCQHGKLDICQCEVGS